MMLSCDRLDNEMYENMRQLTTLQCFGLTYITWGMHYVYCTKCTTVVVYPLICCDCFANAAVTMPPEFFLSELSDSFSVLFLYYNRHASILIDQLSQRNVTVHKLQ